MICKADLAVQCVVGHKLDTLFVHGLSTILTHNSICWRVLYCWRQDVTDPPGPAAGHDLGNPLGCVILLGHTEDLLDLSPAPDHGCCLLRCVRPRVTLRRTETPPWDPDPL